MTMKVFMVCRRYCSIPYKSRRRTAIYARGETKTKVHTAGEQKQNSRFSDKHTNTLVTELLPAWSYCWKRGLSSNQQEKIVHTSHLLSTPWNLLFWKWDSSWIFKHLKRCTFISVAHLFSSKWKHRVKMSNVLVHQSASKNVYFGA